MSTNFEGGREVDIGRENVARALSSFIEENGFWMFEVDGEESEIRFQVWKNENGNPMTHSDGIKDFIERIKTDSNAIPEDATVSFTQMAGGGVHVSVKLDKKV